MEKIEGINLRKLVEECEVVLEKEREQEIEEIRDHIQRAYGRNKGAITWLSPWMRPY